NCTRKKRATTPGVHDSAEYGGNPLRPGGYGIPQKHCEHGRENDHWDRKDKVDPEQPTELSYMVPMTSVTVMMTVVTVLHVMVAMGHVRIIVPLTGHCSPL